MTERVTPLAAHRPIIPAHEVGPFSESEEALARHFTDLHRDELRYVATWGKWLRWDGRRWAIDDTLHVWDMARDVCREAAVKTGQSHIARQIASAKTVAAVERLARADRLHAATVDQWDGNDWLLNTPRD